jgi:hypothetical protein
MLLSNRRLRLLFGCLAGMEMAILSPFVLLLYSRPGLWQDVTPPRFSGTGLFVQLWITLLVMIFIVDLLNRSRITNVQYGLAVMGAVVVGSFVGVRLFVYADLPLTDLRWIGRTIDAVFNFHKGIRPELIFFLVSLLLWQRANNTTSRDVGFFSVGVTFRAGLLIMLLGGGLLAAFSPQHRADAVRLLWICLFLGLIAVALARIDDKATSSPGSSGAMLPFDRFSQLVGVAAVTVLASIGVAQIYTPSAIRHFLGFFRPLWSLLLQLILIVLYVLFLVLEPVLIWLQDRILSLLANLEITSALEGLGNRNPVQELADNAKLVPVGPNWLWVGVRYGLVLLVLATILGYVWLFLERRRRASTWEEAEDTGRADPLAGDNILKRGVDRLRSLGRMLHRYGLGAQLLAAISVENIYANVSRLARKRGFGRPPAMPPDEYLAALVEAFPGQDGALARITAAYMRVHYGDTPVNKEELKQLQADYANIKQTPDPRSEEHNGAHFNASAPPRV